MPDENVQPFDTRLTAEEIKGQIAAWANRMAMAKQQGNEELLKQALERRQSYENQLARLQEFEVDDK